MVNIFHPDCPRHLNWESVSNIAYPLAGLSLLVVNGFNWTMLAVFFILCLLGLSSYLAHGYGGKWWEYDWDVMTISFSALFFYFQHKQGTPYLIELPLVYLYIVLAIVSGFLMYKRGDNVLTKSYEFDVNTTHFKMLIAAVVVSVASSFFVLPTWKIIYTLGIFAVALGMNVLGRKVDDPRNEFIHGWWHVISATGFYVWLV